MISTKKFLLKFFFSFTMLFNFAYGKEKEDLTLPDKNNAKETSSIKESKIHSKVKKIPLSNYVLNKQKKPFIPMHSKLKSKNSHSLILVNNITKESITYMEHWYKPFPSTFSVSINGAPFLVLNNGVLQNIQVPSKKLSQRKTITARYEWTFDKFGKRWHSEEREVEFEIPDMLSALAIDFNWSQDYRLSISQAKILAWREVRPRVTTPR